MHSSDQLVPIDSHYHGSATFSIKAATNELAYNNVYRYNLKKLNINGIIICLSSINWEEFLDFKTLGVEETVDLFYDCLLEAIKLNVPMTGRTASKFPHWYTSELKNVIIVNKISHKK